MSLLVICIPSRQRLLAQSLGAADPGAAPRSTEYRYALSPDGLNLQAQGQCEAALLPEADSVVAVLSDADVGWHRLNLPKAPPARLRAALVGMLEEAVLDDVEAMHFALAPGASAGQPTWVAAVNRAWLSHHLQGLELHQVRVDRVVPMAWPDDPPAGHFEAAETLATPADAGNSSAASGVTLCWSNPDGVAMLRLQGGLARAVVPSPAPEGTRWSASPAAAAAAEQWLGAPVVVMTPAQRALQASRTLWNLRQFDLAQKTRGTRALRDAWRGFLTPAWRPVRYGLAALLVVHIVGLNLWAWQQSANVVAKRQAMVTLLQTTFPQVRAVLDAPLQMQREVQTLRVQAGTPGETDLEPMLAAAALAWPPSRPPVDALRYEPGQLTLAANGWAEADIEQFRSQLRPAGWRVDAAEGRMTLRRAAPALPGSQPGAIAPATSPPTAGATR